MEGWGDGWEGGTTGAEVIEGEAEQNKVNKLLISGGFLEKQTNKQTNKQKSPLRTREAGKHMPVGGGGGSN